MPPIQRFRAWLLPVGVMASLVVILMPLPPVIMDLLLAGNLALAVVILLTTIHIATPLEFSVFPTLLLATTLTRLVLNIATTRLILTGAPTLGEQAAGSVVQTFGQFVAGNQVEVGLILFLILIVVQFVVITKGATRISEVAARFALDGMPGRQSAIDADLNAGNIDNQTASAKRDALSAEADFYSAMDGAGKFVRGDAIAGLVITAINIVGGLYLGVVVSGMGIADAASVFTKLTIGDGLVSQIPSLLISLSAGILVTRGTRKSNLPEDFVTQLLGNSKALFIAGGFLLVLMITGLPLIPLLLLGGGCFLIATTLMRNDKNRENAAEEARVKESEAAAHATTQKRVEDFLTVDPLEVAIGLGLLPLADPSRGGDLMQRIASLRNQMAAEIGIVLPKVRVRDDATLGQQEYEIRLFGDFVARGQLRIDKLLACGDSRTTGTPVGEQVLDPASRREAIWIDPVDREQAMIYGYKTRTAPGVLAHHLEQIARSHADELLSRDATKHLLDELRQVAPAMVDELVPRQSDSQPPRGGRMSVSDVQKVLQGLLREAIPIRQLGIILEALSDASEKTNDTERQIEHVRQRLARTLCAGLCDSHRVMRAVHIDEATLAGLQGNPVTTPADAFEVHGASSLGTDLNGAGQGGRGKTGRHQNQFVTEVDKTQDVTCDAIRQAVKNLTDKGYPPVILVGDGPELGTGARRRVKQIMDEAGIWANVLSTNEITSDTQLELYRTAAVERAATAA
ncbi:flagellar biosynthesis protein FlhA [Stieleria sp. TO1_6]|uniref:flagellar biosynthesis protein FlhA n=1 Tax=Stieleria tagensis TaxID=2956795 RepID=UPI00209B68F9|nr:flagellar biosynthesis protein FlhA [Stieleria tagensis]MCO8123827.1 flagellar biosynthesis protein FlhA [Stieleria tagensis]